MIRVIARPACLACGSSGTALYPGLHDNLFSAPGVWTLSRCSNPACGMLWLDPAPCPDDLPLLYHDYYTHDEARTSTPAVRIARTLHELVTRCLLAPLGVYRERRRAATMFIGGPPRTLLDVGCGDGTFMSTMARQGWQVAGIDFDSQAVARARRGSTLDVEVGTPASHAARGQTYDVVTASHVIEHVPDPVDFLRQCGRLLRPSGQLILRTPNTASYGHRRYGRAWRGLEPPRHLQLFSPGALLECARKAELRVLSCFSSPAQAEAILMISHFLRKNDAFRVENCTPGDLIEWGMLAPWLALRAQYAWWRDRGSGEELYAILAA